MKTLKFLFLLLFFALVSNTSRIESEKTFHPPVVAYEEIPPLDLVSFKDEVWPIFQTKCNMVDCHGEKGKTFPKYTSYGRIKSKAKTILYRLKHKTKPMPPKESGVVLTAEELQKIQRWVKEGRKNN